MRKPQFKLTKPKENSDLNLGAVIVEPRGSGLVQQVAHLICSPVLSRPSSLSELLSSLDSELYFDDELDSAPRPLEIYENGNPSEPYGGPALRTLLIDHLPDRLATSQEADPPPGVSPHVRIEQPTIEAVVEWLDAYPRLKALGEPSSIGSPEPSLDRKAKGKFSIRLTWGGDERVQGVTQTKWTLDQLDIVYSTDPHFSHGVVLPAVGGNVEAQQPLTTWWLVLYILSMLARYYPSVWTRLLDVDSSKLAVPFEHLISVSRAKVPQLIWEAIHDQLVSQA